MRPVLGTSCIFDSLQLADTPSELERKVQSKYYLFNDTKWHLFNISYKLPSDRLSLFRQSVNR